MTKKTADESQTVLEAKLATIQQQQQEAEAAAAKAKAEDEQAALEQLRKEGGDDL